MEVDWRIVGILATLFMAWNGFLVWVIKYLIDRALKGGDRRFERLEHDVEHLSEHLDDSLHEEAEKRRGLEREFREMIADLPLKYVQREDWIRLATTIEAKMDSLNSKFDELKDRIYARG